LKSLHFLRTIAEHVTNSILPLPESTFSQTISTDSVARNSLLLFGFHVFTKLLALVSSVLLANALGSELFGAYSYAFALTSVFLPLADLGMDMYLLRELPREREQFLAASFPPILVAKIVLAGVVLCLMTITGGILESFGSPKFSLILLAGAITLLRALWTTFGYILRSYNAVGSEVSLQGLVRFAEFLAVLIWVFSSTNLLQLMGVLAMVNGTGVLLTYFFIQRKYLTRIPAQPRSALRPILRGSLPFALTSMFTAVYFNFDTVLVAKLVNDHAAGIYRAAYNLIMPLMMVTAAISGAVFPFVSQHAHTRQDEIRGVLRKSVYYLFMVGVPLAMMTTATADRITAFVFKAEFAEASTCLAILIWFIPIVYLTNLFGLVLGAAGEQPYVLRITTLNLVFNLTANIVLIPLFAQIGAAITTVLTELLGLVLLSLRMYQRFGTFFSAGSSFKIIAASALPLLLAGVDLPILALLAMMVMVYAFLLFAFKALSLQEIRSLLTIIRGARETV
jgi:O-antigen/teichoic acid export membrane protein